MEKRIITVSRQFGSGGRSVAKAVAQKLGFDYYDKELIEKVAEQTGYAKEYIAEHGEYAPSRSIFAYSFVGRDTMGISAQDRIWGAQRKIILELAEKGNCVIVGRCADFILRDYRDCLHVFIHAPTADRVERIVRVYGETDVAPEKRLKEKDKKRSINYKYYTDREWGAMENYDLTLNSGVLGLELCEKLILDVVEASRTQKDVN